MDKIEGRISTSNSLTKLVENTTETFEEFLLEPEDEKDYAHLLEKICLTILAIETVAYTTEFLTPWIQTWRDNLKASFGAFDPFKEDPELTGKVLIVVIRDFLKREEKERSFS